MEQFRERCKAILNKYSLADYLTCYSDGELATLFDQHKERVLAIDTFEKAVEAVDKLISQASWLPISINNLISQADMRELYSIFLEAREQLIK